MRAACLCARRDGSSCLSSPKPPAHVWVIAGAGAETCAARSQALEVESALLSLVPGACSPISKWRLSRRSTRLRSAAYAARGRCVETVPKKRIDVSSSPPAAEVTPWLLCGSSRYAAVPEDLVLPHGQCGFLQSPSTTPRRGLAAGMLLSRPPAWFRAPPGLFPLGHGFSPPNTPYLSPQLVSGTARAATSCIGRASSSRWDWRLAHGMTRVDLRRVSLASRAALARALASHGAFWYP